MNARTTIEKIMIKRISNGWLLGIKNMEGIIEETFQPTLEEVFKAIKEFKR